MFYLLDVVRHVGGVKHQSWPPSKGSPLGPDDVIVEREPT